MAGVYGDEAARAGMDPETVVYRVQSYMPRPEGEPGAVCLATTFLMPGMVGDEYFMTRGHFHAKPDGPELEVCLSGEGALILMDESRRTWIEPLHPGAVVPVGPRTAHRAANTGSEPLVFISYWGSEIGHDYATIIREGFGARMMCVDGEPRLIPAS